jgi:hypothetical protein
MGNQSTKSFMADFTEGIIEGLDKGLDRAIDKKRYSSSSSDEQLTYTTKQIENYNDKYTRRGQKWTPDEDDDLINELSEKLSLYNIAHKHGRSQFAIKKRIEKLINENKLDASTLTNNGYFLSYT